MTAYEQIEIQIKNSPTLQMLRSGNAVLTVSFLLTQFKETNEQPIAYGQLTQELADYIDEFAYQNQEETDLKYLGLDSHHQAKRYLEQWSDEQHRYVTVYTDETTKEIMVAPTKYTSRMFQIVDVLKDRKFVGTESKFKDIFNKLRDLVENSIDDPVRKIEKLERQKAEIENEIRRIKREQSVSTFENYQIKSRFDEINKLTNELIGDFREVEDNFRIIVRTIIEKQSDQSLSKGRLLQHTFDALAELRDTDQGKSFYAFWNFLLDDASQDELKIRVAELYRILDERGIEHNDRFLRRAKSILHASGRKVWDSNNLLADKLTRIIAEKNLDERKKVKESINNIRQLALKMIDKPSSDDPFIEIFGDADINLPMERKLGAEQLIAEFNEQPVSAENILDIESLSQLNNMRYINRKELLNNIESLLNERHTITLGEVLNRFPASKGLAEVLAYISLLQADGNGKFVLNKEQTEYLKFDSENEKYLKTPQIIFCK